MYTFFLVILCVFGTISSGGAWFKSSFFVNSKLPNQCGQTKSYNPENSFEGWGFWPWMGLLVYDGTGAFRCNAILIHPQVALTSLICIKHIPEVVLKDHTFIAFSLPGLPSFQNISVTDVDFTGDRYNANQLAILKLEKSVIISSQVHPICLWEEHSDWDQQMRHHIGMMIGSDLNNVYNIRELRFFQAPVKVVSLKSCKKKNDVFFKTPKSVLDGICYTYLNVPIDCHSVGSLMMVPRLADDGNIVWYLRGLVIVRAWFCDRNDFYNTLFDIGQHRRWIESHFKPSVEAGCGRRVVSYTALVTQGTDTVRGDWPWHAAIYIKRGPTYQCGGSLISSNIVLTAAHCVVNRDGVIPAGTFFVFLGKYTLNADEPGSKKFDVVEVITHEKFNLSSLLNDIALLRLTEKVKYNEYIQPGCIWDEIDNNKVNIVNHVGTVVGWGYTEENKVSNDLKSAVIPVKEDIICFQSRANFYDNFLHDKTFCAGNPRGNGTNVCNGDSGGSFMLPIIQPDQEVTWFIRGIVSVAVSKSGLRVCDPDYYAVYTDVSKYKEWINIHLV